MNGLRKILKVTALTLGGLLLLIAAILCALTLWLTPQRLTSLVNTEASKYLKADIQAKNITYTLWSSFPRFNISTDSIIIISRGLANLSPSTRALLPEGCDTLLKLKSFHGGINVVDIFLNRYVVHDVRITGLSINLVAVNDSVNNYNIFPAAGSGFKDIPYISAHMAALKNPGVISYYSLPSDTRASILLSDLNLKKLPRKEGHNIYNLNLGGRVNLASSGLTVLNHFPINMKGLMQLHFKPFEVKLPDYTITLGAIKSTLNMSVGMGDNPGIRHFDYHISTLNLMSLLGYLPKDLLPAVQGLEGNLPINISAKLMKGWDFSSESLPPISISFDIPSGTLTYTAAPGGKDSTITAIRHIPLDYSDISGVFYFNGPDPELSYFRVNPFRLSTEGMALDIDAQVTQLTAMPAVAADVNLTSDLAKLPEFIPYNPKTNNQKMRMEGKLKFASKVNFNFESFSEAGFKKGLRNLLLKGNIDISNAAVSLPEMNLDVKVNHLTAPVNASAASITEREITSPCASISFNIDTISGRAVSIPFTAENISISTASNKAGVFNTSNILSVTPPAIRLRAGSLSATPESAKSGIRISNIDVTLAEDSISLRNASLEYQNIDANIRGNVHDFFPFIKGEASEKNPVVFDITATLDTVNINSLAKSYVTSNAEKNRAKSNASAPGVNSRTSTSSDTSSDAGSASKSLRMDSFSDTTTLLIPRNIRGRMNFSVGKTIYANLHLYDLEAEINIDKGNLHIPHLSINSDFGNAALTLDYLTADRQNMSIAANLKISDVNVVNFFKNFHVLLVMAPAMKNLTGMLSADVKLKGNIFPDMYLNMPSVTADLTVKGWDLKVHQSEFIRKITRMMLIRTDDDIHIRNLTAHAGVHDNLLQLDPFTFEFDRYKLQMEGINNFNGKLYYHIAVDKSPVPFPFSVNIEGMFHHPKLRFGGARYDLKKGEEVTSEIQENNNINVVKIFQSFFKAFIDKAASGTPF